MVYGDQVKRGWGVSRMTTDQQAAYQASRTPLNPFDTLSWYPYTPSMREYVYRCLEINWFILDLNLLATVGSLSTTLGHKGYVSETFQG